MALDKDKLWEDLKKIAEPELEKRAEELRGQFLKNIDDFVDSSRVGVLDDLLVKAANYEIQAVTEQDRNKAEQYATAAEDVLRQVSIVLVAEKVVAEKAIANMIEAAALTVWEGVKSVAAGLFGAVIKGAVSGLLGPMGGAVVEAAGTFLGDTVGPDDSDEA
jgi:hypothetical protein